jgi:VWFA-related protein
MKVQCVLCLFSVLPSFAQPNRPPAAIPPSAAGSVMTLDVLVTDKAGKPVSGLQQSDFTLLDNKQPQKILSFQAVDASSANPPVEVVLVIDEINTPFLRVARIREDLGKFLALNGGKLARPTSVILVTDTGSQNRTPPSQDGNALFADLNKADFGLRVFKRSEQGFYGASDQQQVSLQSLFQVIDFEAARPGRKLVVWISPGWPLFLGGTENMTSKELQSLFTTEVSYTDALQRAGITLSEVDPSGAQQNEIQLSDFQQFYRGVKGTGQVQLGDVGLQALAYRSGGRVLIGDNDMTSQIITCAGDADSFYRIAFERLPGDGPNEFHALDLKVDKPKLTARTQAGYYAQPAR